MGWGASTARSHGCRGSHHGQLVAPQPPAIRANWQGLAEPPIRSERGRAAIVGLQTLNLEFEETVSPGRYGTLVADHLGVFRCTRARVYQCFIPSAGNISGPDRSLTTRLRVVWGVDLIATVVSIPSRFTSSWRGRRSVQLEPGGAWHPAGTWGLGCQTPPGSTQGHQHGGIISRPSSTSV